MRCIVTGAAGFIGSHLCERLLTDGHEVIGVDNFATGQARNLDALGHSERFTFRELDICDRWSIDGNIDVLFNFACPASPIDFISKSLEILQVCSAGVRNGLTLARDKQAVFVQASTSECYGDPEQHPQTESYWGHVNPIGERSAYDEGKRFAEALVSAYHCRYGIKTRIGRIFNTYGPRMRLGDGRVLPNFMQQALENKPLTVYGDGSQTRSFCYVTDLVDGFVRLAGCEEAAPINIGNDLEISIKQFAEEIINLTHSDSVITSAALPADDPKLRCPDLAKAKRVLGWRPTTPRHTGLKLTIDYFRTLLGALA